MADFLSFLVDETFKLQKDGEAALSRLELKIKDYQLEFLKGEFIPQTQMLRFETPFGLMDIPINWSIFNTQVNSTCDHIIGLENDDDHLLNVLTKSWNVKAKKLLITHADGFCYVVGLRAGEENHIHDLLQDQEFLKAA